MKLEFQLLVVDDSPDELGQAVGLLKDHLEAKGFSLECHYPKDLSESGLKKLARNSGRNFDLVAVDFNLGVPDFNGAHAAGKLRHDLRYTDMVFYSSDPAAKLLEELAKNHVSGVFVAARDDLDDMLKGLADTVIGKVVDLNHMRGIAMAAVADMDVQMESVLETVFKSSDTVLAQKGGETLKKLLEGEEKRIEKLRETVAKGDIIGVVTNGELFNSMQRFKAISRVCRVLASIPADALEIFKKYDEDIIKNRNTLAHAKENSAADGTTSLSAIKLGNKPVIIDDDWMKLFRSKLRIQKNALAAICDALITHVDGLATDQSKKA